MIDRVHGYVSKYGADVTIAAIHFAVGVIVALFIARHYTGSPEFYQREFGPAVMTAIGRGFVEPVVIPGSPLSEFLQRRRPAISFDEARQFERLIEPNALQHASRYLMTTVAWWWKLRGLSWHAVWGVTAILYGFAAVVTYGLLRVWLSRPLATLGALWLSVSTVQVEQLPHLRDYSKTPFVLAALALTALVARRNLTRRTMAIASAVCGAVVGVGIGFRSDVMIGGLVFVPTVLLFRGSRPWFDLGDKALAIGTFVAGFAVFAFPILARTSGSGSNPYHPFLLGYTEPFDATLRLRPSVYGYGLVYSDAYVEEAVSAHSERRFGRPATYPSTDYNVASRAYWLAIVRHFPADVLTRWIASASGILNLPFQNRPPDFLNAPLVADVFIESTFGLLRRFDNLGLLVGALLVALAAGRTWHDGFFAATQLAALFGIASLEFERRHVFHLQIIPVLALLLSAQVAWTFARSARNGSLAATWKPAGRRALYAVIVVATLVVASEAVLRAYQTRHLRGLFSQYVDAPRHPVSLCYDTGDDVVTVRWPQMAPPLAMRTTKRGSAYYSLEFNWKETSALVAIGLRYRTSIPPDLSRLITLVARPGVNRVMFPVYTEPDRIEFDGLELSEGVHSTLLGVYRIDNASRLPLPLDLQLPDGWNAEPLYETMRQENSRFAHDVRFVDALDRRVRIKWVSRLASPTLVPRVEELSERYMPQLTITPDGMALDARIERASAPVARFAPVSLRKGSALVAHGVVRNGGLALGLLEGDIWRRRAEILSRGAFVAILEVDRDGVYSPFVAAAAPKDRWQEQFTLFRIGAVDAAR